MSFGRIEPQGQGQTHKTGLALGIAGWRVDFNTSTDMYIHMNRYNALLPIIADPVRQQILAALQGGELPVGALVAQVGVAQSGVSRHLHILHKAGAVQVRAQGQQRLYALRKEAFDELDQWLAVYRALWAGRLDRMAGALAERQLTGERDD
jgi:DNA-binding transcriptional ArsR family regulator